MDQATHSQPNTVFPPPSTTASTAVSRGVSNGTQEHPNHTLPLNSSELQAPVGGGPFPGLHWTDVMAATSLVLTVTRTHFAAMNCFNTTTLNGTINTTTFNATACYGGTSGTQPSLRRVSQALAMIFRRRPCRPFCKTLAA